MLIQDSPRGRAPSSINMGYLNNCLARAVAARHTDKKVARHWLREGRKEAMLEVARLGSDHPQWDLFRVKFIRFEKRGEKRIAREWRKQKAAMKCAT